MEKEQKKTLEHGIKQYVKDNPDFLKDADIKKAVRRANYQKEQRSPAPIRLEIVLPIRRGCFVQVRADSRKAAIWM